MPRFDLPDIYSTAHIHIPTNCEKDPLRALPVLSESLLPCEAIANAEKDEKSTPSLCPSISDSSVSVDTSINNQQNIVDALNKTTGNTHEFVECNFEDNDSEFLRKHYGKYDTALSDGDASTTKCTAKHKAKLPIDITLSDSVKAEVDSDQTESDSESELEWEDVGPALDFDLQGHGIATHGFSIPIQLDAVPVFKEDENNSSVLIALRDNKHLLVDKYLPAINKLMEVSNLMKHGWC